MNTQNNNIPWYPDHSEYMDKIRNAFNSTYELYKYCLELEKKKLLNKEGVKLKNTCHREIIQNLHRSNTNLGYYHNKYKNLSLTELI